MNRSYRTAIDLALRDLLRTGRSMFAVMFALVIPLTLVSVMYLAVGGLGRGEDTFPRVKVYVVDLDSQQAGGGPLGTTSVGSLVVDFLQSEELADVLDTAVVGDVGIARTAVDSGDAAVAVILPEDLSTALYSLDGKATVRVIQDPTLTIGPGIVRAILVQFLDAFSGAQTMVRVLVQTLGGADIPVSPETIEASVGRYVAWAQATGAGLRNGESAFAAIEPVQADEEQNPMQGFVTGMMAAMLVVYAFYTGSAAAQSVLREEEEGTLQRLFMAPIAIPTVVAGKVLASALTLLVQITCLLVVSRLAFGIAWGAALPVALAIVALVALAASFGIFVMSLVTHENQVGVIYGAVMTLTGLFGTYAYFLPLPDAFRRWALIVPQGWAMRSWDIVVRGGGLSGELLLSVGVCVILAGLFLVVGSVRFSRRFAKFAGRAV